MADNKQFLEQPPVRVASWRSNLSALSQKYNVGNLCCLVFLEKSQNVSGID